MSWLGWAEAGTLTFVVTNNHLYDGNECNKQCSNFHVNGRNKCDLHRKYDQIVYNIQRT